MENATVDIYDIIAILLSIGSSIVAMASLYFSYLKRGRIIIPPVRMYRLDPRTFNDVRSLKVTMPMTFMNTGAGQRVVADLRINVKTGDGPLYFTWREELESLRVFEPRGTEQLPTHPFQPTLNSYESVSRVYAFMTEPGSSDAVKALDAAEGGVALPATIELRNDGRWKPLRRLR